MIKIKVEEGTCKMQVKGNGLTTMAESLVIVKSLYEAINGENETAGQVFLNTLKDLCKMKFNVLEKEEEKKND